MVAPAIIAGGLIGGGLLGGGIAGGLLSRKGLPTPDISGIQNSIARQAAQERNLLGRIRPETQALLDQFKQDVSTAQSSADEARRQASQAFLEEIDPLTSRIVQQQTDALKRQVFGAIPETVQASREAAAASGGLQRGTVAQQLANIPTQAAGIFGEGVSGITQQALQAQRAARESVFNAENQAIAQNLGIDAATYNTILASGNQALINELNGLIQTARNQGAQEIAAEQFRQTGILSSEAFKQQQQQALFNALAGTGGTILGASLTRGMGSPTGATPSPTTTPAPFSPQSPAGAGQLFGSGLQGPIQLQSQPVMGRFPTFIAPESPLARQRRV